MTSIAGRNAIVTGAGSGIGRAVALALAQEGAAVGVADIVAANAEAVVAEIAKRGGRAVPLVCDVSDRSAVRGMKAEANRRLGPISLVVANAGVTMFEPLTAMSDDDIDWVVQVSLFGVLNCLQIFLPDMIAARAGHVAATASAAALLAPFIGDHAPYIAAKAGVVGMMLSMRRELEPHGIGATVLCPSAVATGIANSPQYRPERFGGPVSATVHVPTIQEHGRPPEEAARMLLAAIRDNRAVVVTDSGHRDHFERGFAAQVRAAFDEAERFDRER